MNNNNLPPRGSVEAPEKLKSPFITENQKIPDSNLTSPDIGGAALAGRANGTDIHNTDTAFPDYRQKFETDPVKNSIETILSIGKSLASLREQAANNPRS